MSIHTSQGDDSDSNNVRGNLSCHLINRQIAVSRPKQEPLLDWIKAADPSRCDLTLAEFQEDCESFLTLELNDEAAAQRWALKHWREIFGHRLNGWHTDLKPWPQNRSPRLLLQSYEMEIHSMVWDLANRPLLFEDFGGEAEVLE